MSLDPDASRTATDVLALKDVRLNPDADFSALEELVRSDLIRLRGSIKLAMTVERAASVEVGQESAFTSDDGRSESDSPGPPGGADASAPLTSAEAAGGVSVQPGSRRQEDAA